MKLILFLILKNFILYGQLDVIISGDPARVLKGQKVGPHVQIKIKNISNLFSIIKSPELSFGELYMNGELLIVKGNLEDLIKFLMLNYDSWNSSLIGQFKQFFGFIVNHFRTIHPISYSKQMFPTIMI